MPLGTVPSVRFRSGNVAQAVPLWGEILQDVGSWKPGPAPFQHSDRPFLARDREATGISVKMQFWCRTSPALGPPAPLRPVLNGEAFGSFATLRLKPHVPIGRFQMSRKPHRIEKPAIESLKRERLLQGGQRLSVTPKL